MRIYTQVHMHVCMYISTVHTHFLFSSFLSIEIANLDCGLILNLNFTF